MVQVSLHTLLLDLIASVLLGAGVIALGSPLALYFWIHGAYDRYIWIIHGPYPYSHFGGGPFQMAMGVGLLGLAGALLFSGLFLKWWVWRRVAAEFVL